MCILVHSSLTVYEATVQCSYYSPCADVMLLCYVPYIHFMECVFFFFLILFSLRWLLFYFVNVFFFRCVSFFLFFFFRLFFAVRFVSFRMYIRTQVHVERERASDSKSEIKNEAKRVWGNGVQDTKHGKCSSPKTIMK